MDPRIAQARKRIGLWALNSRNRLGRIEAVLEVDDTILYTGVSLDGKLWQAFRPRIVHPDDGDRLDAAR